MNLISVKIEPNECMISIRDIAAGEAEITDSMICGRLDSELARASKAV
jgi:hypothetical protein